MIRIKATLFFKSPYWMGSFERLDQEGYAVASHIFGSEPTDSELYDFVLNHYEELHFGKPREFELIIKRKNPKRVQREVRKEMEKLKESQLPSTFAQDVMKQDLEAHKQEKKKSSKEQKEEKKRVLFNQKQQKKKAKLRGR